MQNDARRRRKSKRMVQRRPTAIVVSIVEHITVIMELMVKRERCRCVRAIIIENNPVVLWSTVHPAPFCMSNDKNPFAEAIRFVWEALARVYFRLPSTDDFMWKEIRSSRVCWRWARWFLFRLSFDAEMVRTYHLQRRKSLLKIWYIKLSGRECRAAQYYPSHRLQRSTRRRVHRISFYLLDSNYYTLHFRFCSVCREETQQRHRQKEKK